MFIRKYIYLVLVSYFVIGNALADWQIQKSGENESSLMQRQVSTDSGVAAVAVMCGGGEPILLVEWTAKFQVIQASIDGVELKFKNQFLANKNVQAIMLESGQANALIKGKKLELVAIPLLSDKSYAFASLIGFTKAYNEASMDCK